LPTNAPGFQPPGLGPSPREVVWRPLSGVAINSDQLAVFVAAVAVAVLLWLVLRHTRVGLEMRAGVDRRELAGLRGVSAAKTSVVAWVLSMMLAGLGGVLIAPLQGLGDINYTLVVLGSLAAVVAAGLRSIPIAFAAGLLLGVLQNLVFGYAPDFLSDISGFLSSIPFLLTIVLLFFLGFDRTRAAGSVADESPPEDHRAGLPRWRRILPWTIAVSALVVYELWFANEFWSSLIAKGIVLGIVFLSFVVITGLGGMVSLGQATFVTASAFTVGYLVNTEFGFTIPLLMHDGRFSFFAAVVAGTAVAAAAGALIAIPVRRLGPLALALATLSVAFIAELIVFQLDVVRNGSRGWPVPPLNLQTFESELPLGPFDFTRPHQLAMLALLVFGAVTLIIRNLQRSASGRAVLAVRSSEVAARTSGIAAGWSKVSLFAVSAGIAGLGGAFLAVVSSPVNNRSAPAFVGLIWLAVTVTFGIRRPGGALLAGLAFACFTDLLQVITGWGFMPDWAASLTGTTQLAAILFGVGAINLAKNPDGVLALVGTQRLERRRRRERDVAARDAGRVVAPPARVPLAAPSGDGVADAGPVTLGLEGIVAGYGEVEVLHGVDLAVPAGRVVTLLGPNGAGKSTLCAVAAGLLAPTAGCVRLDDRDVTDQPAFRRARRGLLLAPEARGIFPGLSVDENLSVLLRSAREREQAYERFPLLADRRRQPAGLLSGGEQQMLALAPALVRTPALFVADEPSLGLAPMASEAVFEALTELRQRGSSLLLVEEKAREALELADVVAVMELGRIVWIGPRQEADADRLAAVYLGVRV
jgi:ABC-type branched-subunit amino acid transport system ATPase component/ABC-type branched-subunit amino acid transport system permease subunit